MNYSLLFFLTNVAISLAFLIGSGRALPALPNAAIAVFFACMHYRKRGRWRDVTCTVCGTTCIRNHPGSPTCKMHEEYWCPVCDAKAHWPLS